MTGLWFVVLALPGCSWFESELPESEIETLRAEVDQLRTEMARMRVEDDVAHDVLAQEVGDAPAPAETVRRSDLSALKGDITEASGVALALDEELGAVEDELEAQRQNMLLLQQEIEALEVILNNHADVIDLLVSDVDALETETAPLLRLSGVLTLDKGQVVIDGADLVFQPGQNADGSVRKTGPVFPVRTF